MTRLHPPYTGPRRGSDSRECEDGVERELLIVLTPDDDGPDEVVRRYHPRLDLGETEVYVEVDRD